MFLNKLHIRSSVSKIYGEKKPNLRAEFDGHLKMLRRLEMARILNFTLQQNTNV